MRTEKALKFGSVLLLAGIVMIGLVLVTPDAAGSRAAGSFFTTATSSSWGTLTDLTAAWCSFKIILLSVGVFLVVDVLGTTLLVLKHKRLAWMVYTLHLGPCAGVFVGCYCLIKAVL